MMEYALCEHSSSVIMSTVGAHLAVSMAAFSWSVCLTSADELVPHSVMSLGLQCTGV